MRIYEKREALALTGATEQLLSRWAQDGIIVPVAGGGARGAHRGYSLLNLFEIAVCRRLHLLGVKGPMMRAVLDRLAEHQYGSWRGSWHELVRNPTMLLPAIAVSFDADHLDGPDDLRDLPPSIRIIDTDLGGSTDDFGLTIALSQIRKQLEAATAEAITEEGINELMQRRRHAMSLRDRVAKMSDELAEARAVVAKNRRRGKSR